MITRTAVVEDDDAIRQSLILLLESTEEFRCVGAYRTGEEAATDIPLKMADVVLMDIKLPGMSGIDCVKQLKERSPAIEIIMLTVFEDSEKIFGALQAGASGYLLKRTPPAEILAGINTVRAGGSPMSAEIARRVVDSFKQRPAAAVEFSILTEREEQILQHLIKGKRYKEIAEVLFISASTVHAHLHKIYEKLHVRSRSEAIIKYLQK